jgi:hypothetical protein
LVTKRNGLQADKDSSVQLTTCLVSGVHNLGDGVLTGLYIWTSVPVGSTSRDSNSLKWKMF